MSSREPRGDGRAVVALEPEYQDHHGPVGHKIVMIGVVFGLTNAALMAFKVWWPMSLITFHAWIGFHGPAIDRLHAHQI